MSFIIPAKTVVKAVIILLHGYGTSAHDFADIGDYISRVCENAEVHVLDGFYEIEPGSRMWFALDNDDVNQWRRDIQPAGNMLADYIDRALAETNSKNDVNLTYKNVILAGFSQGGMMSLHVGLLKNVQAIVSFSGVLVDENVVTGSANPEVLFVHGTHDNVIKIEDMEASFKRLSGVGIPCKKHIQPGMKHSITASVLNFATTFMRDEISKMP